LSRTGALSNLLNCQFQEGYSYNIAVSQSLQWAKRKDVIDRSGQLVKTDALDAGILGHFADSTALLVEPLAHLAQKAFERHRLAMHRLGTIPSIESDSSDLWVRLVLMRLSRLPPMKVLSTQRLQSLQSASSV
jgi:hypothetical protein